MNNTLAKEIVKHLMQEVEDGLERAEKKREKADTAKERTIENRVAGHYYAGKISAYEEVKMLLKCWKESLGEMKNDEH